MAAVRVVGAVLDSDGGVKAAKRKVRTSEG